MLQWQQAIETFLGFEAEHDRMCYKTKKKTKKILMEFYDLCHSQWLCIAYRIQFWVTLQPPLG